MTLDEAVKYSLGVVENNECAECREEYRQLAECLKELTNRGNKSPACRSGEIAGKSLLGSQADKWKKSGWGIINIE